MLFSTDPGIVQGIARRRSVLLLIDVEPNARKIFSNAGGWEGTEAAVGRLEHFRRRLEDKTDWPVQFSWFLRADPQIQALWGKPHWIAEAMPQIFKTIEEHGDYCGIHPHLWRWDPRRSEWFNELGDPLWTAECLGTAIEGYRRVFQRSPEACRFGDRWLNQKAVDLMQANGIRYDLTIEPGLPDEPIFDDPRATGWLPDYRSSVRVPYCPSPENFLIPHPGGAVRDSIWMVPLTTTPPVWRPVRRPPYVLRASRPLNLSLSHFSMWPHLNEQLGLETDLPLTFVLRTGDFATPRFFRNIVRTMERLATHPGLARCEFTNPAAVVEKWRALS